MKGYRCHKAIYLNIASPELEAKITPELQARFDQGNAVGEEARMHFPGGMLVDFPPWDFIGSLKKTREHIANGVHTIYEAAFEYSNCYARVDILKFSPETKKWSIFEVKSSTKVKAEQLDDVGLQAWIIAKSGLPLEKISILHLNTECRYPNLENLFTTVDVTAEIRERYLGIQPKVRGIFDVLQQPTVPAIDIGAHCLVPNECGFREHCWKEKRIPELSVLDLPKIADRKWDLYKKGIIELTDPRLKDELIDADQSISRMIDVHRSGERYLDPAGIKKAMAEWKFPLVFLDFETINPAIPRYDGTGPFQQVPFQFSVHTWETPESDLEHLEYLHEDSSDPRPALIPALLAACEGTGSIVSYYAKFESERITEMAEVFPEYRRALLALLPRMVDPLPIVREFVYDKAFGGSFSLKAVAPALLGAQASYEGLAVGDGTAAQRAFEELISEDTDPERKEEISGAMLEYCGKDTLVMVDLVKWLLEVSSRTS